jgi:hypothetical protein
VLVLGAGFIHSLVMLLSQPFFALLIGLSLGVGLLAASRSSFRLVKAENTTAGIALVSLLLFARMGVAAAVLWAYHRFVAGGFVLFATGFAGGFLVAYVVALVRYAGPWRAHTR